MIWKQKMSMNGGVMYGAANGLVLYYGSTSAGPAGDILIAARTSDGSTAWTAPLPGYASIVSDATHLYITYTGQGTKVDSLTSADGKTAWSHSWPSTEAHQTSVSDPAVYNNVMYIGVSNFDSNMSPIFSSTVYALSATDGSTLWKQTITGDLQYPVETNYP